MKTKLGQIAALIIVGIIGVVSASAQEMNMDGYTYRHGNTLPQSATLKTTEGLISSNKQYAAILQTDGNFCLYKLAQNGKAGQFVHCTMTVGDQDKQGSFLSMQNDGNLVLYNSKKAQVWSTDTYRGSDEQRGRRLVLEDSGKLILYSRSSKVAAYDFQQGRLY